jgi:predicted acylesterase/phospholipase RssA
VAAQEHRNYCDLVCEGGGVKGIGLAGAFSVLEEHDFRPQNVAGTSPGAITAALIAAGYTAAELKDVIFGMDFLKFRDTAWEYKLPLVGKGVSIFKDLGIYEGRYFEDWIGELLKAKGAETFSALTTDEYGDDPRYRYRLQVIASDTTSHRLLVLPRDADQLGIDPDELSVARAVRMSMSIPIFFEPVSVTNEKTNREHVIVDGGMLSNFPVWLFDCPDAEVPSWPTFGLLLVEPHPQYSDRRASAGPRARATRARRALQVREGDGGHDDGGARPALCREGELRAHHPDPHARDRDDRVRRHPVTEGSALPVWAGRRGGVPRDVGLRRLHRGVPERQGASPPRGGGRADPGGRAALGAFVWVVHRRQLFGLLRVAP